MNENTGPRVLVVDNDPAHRALYATTLQESGYRVQEAASGQEALTVLRRRTPDLVVLDVRMPGTDGLELLRQLARAIPSCRYLLVTAFAVRDAVVAIKLGAVDYLKSPSTWTSWSAVCGARGARGAAGAGGRRNCAGLIAESRRCAACCMTRRASRPVTPRCC